MHPAPADALSTRPNGRYGL